MADYIKALKQWTGKSAVDVVFDSAVDEFTSEGLFQTIRQKSDIALVGFTTDGDVFGVYLSVVVDKEREELKDTKCFVFSLESHGRCETPKRFYAKEELKNEGPCMVYAKNYRSGFIAIRSGNGCFWLGNEKSNAFCMTMSKGFEGLLNTTLTGRTYNGYTPSGYDHYARLIAIQLS